MVRTGKVLACDFETTVYQGQTTTEVWAAACVEVGTENVLIFHSIEEQFNYFKMLNCNIIAYYHNLKFDGAFWLDYMLRTLQFKQAVDRTGENEFDVTFRQNNKMENNTFKYSISSFGQWYTLTIKVNNHFIELRDSLKLLPFKLRDIANSFQTKHKKLDMEYTGQRYAGCDITTEEKQYISNDVLVLKEALEIMFKDGHDKLTIGSCCMNEFKAICNASTKNLLSYEEMFPDLYTIPLAEKYGSPSVGEYVRKSYKGGWCYLVKGKENKMYRDGATADVNSLYPSMMHSESENRYPIGKPVFWSGNFIPDKALEYDKYFFIRIKTRFYIKKQMLPFIQIKHSYLYKSNECLESSDVFFDGQYYTHYKKDGAIVDTSVILTLTMTDYYLLKEHYELVDFEILDGCYFNAQTGIFDEYIDKYKKIKIENKEAKRTEAKLFLNNLYGKLASSTDSSFKFAYMKEDGTISFATVTENNKKAGYIPCGSAITSYARNFTIRAAQKNYHGTENRGFIYADTDSIHCDLEPEELVGIKVDKTAFCCWNMESKWDEAIFIRQKTYIEHVIEEELTEQGGKYIGEKTTYYNIKCAGMPERCKQLLNASITGKHGETQIQSEDEKAFLYTENGEEIIRELTDFKVGLKVPSKLIPKRIQGGVLLVNTTYEMR